MVQHRSATLDDAFDFPATLMIGEFTLVVDEITDLGRWDEARRELRGVSGTAWLKFDCASTIRVLDPRLRPEFPVRQHSVEVVSRVTSQQTQISLDDAQRVRPDIQVGETLTLEIAVAASELQEIAQFGAGVSGWLDKAPRKGQVLVEFEKAVVGLDESKELIGHIIKGNVVYPAHRRFPAAVEIEIDGFTLVISSLTLTTRGATGAATVRLPAGLAAMDSCQPATLDLGVIRISPTCDFYVDAPTKAYGPWLLGDTGLEIKGTGYVLDLSTSTSPFGWLPGWRGLVLLSGQATGKNLVPDPCNTGYLRGTYDYANAVVTRDGFDGLLTLHDKCRFRALNPRGHILTLVDGWLHVIDSKIAAGNFGPGEVELPTDAVCDGVAGNQIVVRIDNLTVQPDLDLAGQVDYDGRAMNWGELTHHGAEVIAWMACFAEGYLYLPAGAVASFSPESGGSFTGPYVTSTVDASLTELEVHGVAGVTFPFLTKGRVFSPDRPGGVGNPLDIPTLNGWLRIGSLGVDGELHTYNQLRKEPLGDPARSAYVGVVPFEADLFVNEKYSLVAQFATSAVFDSNFGGRFTIPAPCKIAALPFEHMQISSTSHLVGGDVELPPGGVPLDYWQVDLVSTGPPGTPAGVVSARTGRVVFMAAGISEPVHFARPFGLTWGEMLASGDLGELYLDYNNYGQRFDGLTFNPHKFLLSKYVAGTTDPYLAAAGSILFPFFGIRYANIHDAVDPNMAGPNFGRKVTVPKTPIAPGLPVTELALAGTWKDILSNDLAMFECPELQVDYNVTGQNGFFGTGTSEMSFLHSNGLDIVVEIHSDATDIHISSMDNHDIDLGLFARLSGVADISGCARIEGPLLTRMSFYGILEESAQGGAILGPKVGYSTEIGINVTPSTLDFYASGDMLMSVSAVDIELSATVHLLFDFAMLAAEGELIGRINCDAVIAGLSGEGQVTWHVSPTMQYLQGRMKVAVCSWVASGGMEGGFFVGRNVPKQLAWVLQSTNPHFGVSQMILPATLTGVFGYGQLSIGVNLYVLGGGVDIYAGMGAFSTAPPGLSPAFAGVVGLPYVIGACGVYVHGEILGGLVSASAWANLSLRGPFPVFFEGTFGLRGCAAWVLCASVEVTGGLNSGGFYLF